MYVKQPSSASSNNARIKIPDNYGGNAFSSSYYADMPPPARQSVPNQTEQNTKPSSSPISESPPKSSPLVDRLRHSEPLDDDIASADDQVAPTPPESIVNNSSTPRAAYAESADKDTATQASSHTTSLLSSLIPKTSFLGNFPFGHGIGGEELLILGIMLLVYLSGYEKGEIDGEFIILLALLLFAG